ncbi:MAG: hypothetical protein ACRDYC_05040, partial [Acidimicrobiales bacterium]
MLLLLTVGLVLAGLVLLVIGFAGNSVGYIYAAIVCGAVAGVVLLIITALRARATPEGEYAPEPRHEPSYRPPVAASRPERTSAFRSSPAARPGPPEELGALGRPPSAEAPEYTPPPARIPAVVSAPAAPAARTAPPPRAASRPPQPPPPVEPEEPDWEGWDEVVFPIEDYDDLRVGEILPLLPELDAAELAEVRDREAAGKDRGLILRRIDSLLSERGVAPARAGGPSNWAPSEELDEDDTAESEGKQEDLAEEEEDEEEEAQEEEEEELEEEEEDLELEGAPRGAVAPAGDEELAEQEEDEEEDEALLVSLEEYDSMWVAEILRLLPDLHPDDLAVLRQHERAHQNRADVVERIDLLIAEETSSGAAVAAGATEGEAEAEEEPEALLTLDAYDRMSVGDVLSILTEMFPEDLPALYEHEATHQARPVVLRRIEGLMAAGTPGSTAMPTSADQGGAWQEELEEEEALEEEEEDEELEKVEEEVEQEEEEEEE